MSGNTAVESRDTRLVARCSGTVHELVRAAAELSGASLSQFVLDSATKRAREVIESENTIRLSLEGAEAVFSAIDNPPPTTVKLLEAASRFKHNSGFSYAKNGPTGQECT